MIVIVLNTMGFEIYSICFILIVFYCIIKTLISFFFSVYKIQIGVSYDNFTYLVDWNTQCFVVHLFNFIFGW